MVDKIDTIILILQVLQTTDYNSPMNSPQIQHKINELCDKKYNIDYISVERKTIAKYIKHLQYLGYPIEQCRDKKRGWYCSKPLLNTWQIKLLYDCVLQSRCISKKDTYDLCQRLLSFTSKGERSKIMNMITPYSSKKISSEYTGQYIETILNAIHDKRKITFFYGDMDQNMNMQLRKNEDCTNKKYELNVYSLYWSNDNYYIIGVHDNHKDCLTNYRLDRIFEMKMSDKTAVEAKEYLGDNPENVIQHYIETRVNNYSGESHYLMLEFEYQPKYMNILYDFAGDSIKIIKLKNGKLQARVEKQNSPTLMGWLMQYATIFKVMEPDTIRKELVEKLKDGLAVYDE